MAKEGYVAYAALIFAITITFAYIAEPLLEDLCRSWKRYRKNAIIS